MKSKNLFFTTIGSFLFIGCSATTQNFPVPDTNNISKEEAIIQVRRESGVFGAARTVDIYDFDKKIGELGNDGVLTWSKSQGKTCLGIYQSTYFIETSVDIKCFIAKKGEITKVKFDYLKGSFSLENSNENNK
jgi:hypothetical protein